MTRKSILEKDVDMCRPCNLRPCWIMLTERNFMVSMLGWQTVVTNDTQMFIWSGIIEITNHVYILLLIQSISKEATYKMSGKCCIFHDKDTAIPSNFLLQGSLIQALKEGSVSNLRFEISLALLKGYTKKSSRVHRLIFFERIAKNCTQQEFQIPCVLPRYYQSNFTIHDTHLLAQPPKLSCLLLIREEACSPSYLQRTCHKHPHPCTPLLLIAACNKINLTTLRSSWWKKYRLRDSLCIHPASKQMR